LYQPLRPEPQRLVSASKEKRTGELSFGGYQFRGPLCRVGEIPQKNFDLFNWRFYRRRQSVSLSARIGSISPNYDLSLWNPIYSTNKCICPLTFTKRSASKKTWILKRSRVSTLSQGPSRTFFIMHRLHAGNVKTTIFGSSPQRPRVAHNFISKWRADLSTTARQSCQPHQGSLLTFNGDLLEVFWGEHDYYMLQTSATHYWTLSRNRFGSQDRWARPTVLALGRSSVFDRFYAGGWARCAGLITGAWAERSRDAVRGNTITMQFGIHGAVRNGCFQSFRFVDAANVHGFLPCGFKRFSIRRSRA